MNISLSISDMVWKPVFVIDKESCLVKGSNDFNKTLLAAASKINNHYLCYAWGNGQKIYYCGSVAQDYRNGQFQTNLQGRVHNYLSNHRLKENGRENTNLNVFNHLQETLLFEDITLSFLSFSRCRLGDIDFTYDEYSDNADLVHAVEQLFIAYYKELGQCIWNRTGKSAYSKYEKTQEHKKAGPTILTKSLADQVREYIYQQIILPSRASGLSQVNISAKKIHHSMGLKNHFPTVCQVLDGEKFTSMAKVELISRSGPKMSSTVTWQFKL